MTVLDWLVAVVVVVAALFIGALVILNAVLDSDGREFK